jgi:hypothetical protein
MSDIGEVAKAVQQFGKVAELVLQPAATWMEGFSEASKVQRIAKAEIAAADAKQRAVLAAERRAIRHQQNLERIVSKTQKVIEFQAAKKLLPETAGATESDPDWHAKFAAWAGESSDEDIQALWAKVLAGEFAQPGRFSLRLLNAVRLLRKSDAQKFEKLAGYVWADENDDCFVLTTDAARKRLRDEQAMDVRFYKVLMGLGLIRRITWEFAVSKSDQPRRCAYQGRWISFTWRRGPSDLHALELTELGTELYHLCDVQPNEDYFQIVTGLGPGWTIQRLDGKPTVEANPRVWDSSTPRLGGDDD